VSNVQEIISGLNEIQVSFALAGEKAGPDSHHMRLSRLCGAAIEALQNQVEVSPAPVLDDVRIWVASELQAFGVAPHIRGKRYLIEAIVMVIEQPSYLEMLVKGLYSDIAEKFSTTPSRVERAIRHAIEKVFDDGDVDLLHHLFNVSAKGKAPNGEFIATMADRWALRHELRRAG